MKCILGLMLVTFCLSGCFSTTWECRGNNCSSYHIAMNKCLVQANSAFSNYRREIWAQCMRGEGFEEKECDPSRSYPNPCVAMGLHVR